MVTWIVRIILDGEEVNVLANREDDSDHLTLMGDGVVGVMTGVVWAQRFDHYVAAHLGQGRWPT